MVLPNAIAKDDEVVSPSEAAKILGVHRSTVHVWLREGMLKSTRVGRHHAIAITELRQFVKTFRAGVPPVRKPRKRKKRSG